MIKIKNNKTSICNRCVMDATDKHIKFNEKNICDYCINFEAKIFPDWEKKINSNDLEKISDKIKHDTRGHNYNCIIGISGGVDSSYVAHVSKKNHGLKSFIISC